MPNARYWLLSAAALVALTDGPAEAGNVLSNPNFDGTLDATTTLTGNNSGNGLSGPSPAPPWLVWNNSDATTTTTLIHPTGGGNELVVGTGGPNNGIYQIVQPGNPVNFADVDVLVNIGSFELGIAYNGRVLATVPNSSTNQWQHLTVSTVETGDEIIFYQTDGSGGTFSVANPYAGWVALAPHPHPCGAGYKYVLEDNRCCPSDCPDGCSLPTVNHPPICTP